MLNILVAYIVAYRFSAKTARRCFVVAVGIAAIANAAFIWHGYAVNGRAGEVNEARLAEAAQQVAGGEQVDKVILYRFADDSYANELPYNKTYIVKWIKYYYRIPQSTELVYLDYDALDSEQES